jgi:hypothetical protein
LAAVIVVQTVSKETGSDLGSFRGSTIGFVTPENIRATEQPVVFVFIDAPEPVEMGKVGEVRPKFPFELNYHGFARCGRMEDQAGAAKPSN